MAEWGIDAAEIAPLDMSMMMAAYMRRKKFEARIQAIEIWDLLGKAMGGSNGRSGRSGSSKNVKHGMAALQSLGAEIK